MPQRPVGLLQEIICDADLCQFGTPLYPSISMKLWAELCAEKGDISLRSFVQGSLEMLRSHQFFTAAGRTLWNAGQERMIVCYLALLFRYSRSFSLRKI